jgi:hypothetical protein
MISLRIHANVRVCKEKTEKEGINMNKWYSLDNLHTLVGEL